MLAFLTLLSWRWSDTKARPSPSDTLTSGGMHCSVLRIRSRCFSRERPLCRAMRRKNPEHRFPVERLWSRAQTPSVVPLGYAITPGFPPPKSLPSYHAAQRLSSTTVCSRRPSQSANLHAQICRLSGGLLNSVVGHHDSCRRYAPLRINDGHSSPDGWPSMCRKNNAGSHART